MLRSINGPFVGALLVGLGAGSQFARHAIEAGYADAQSHAVVTAVLILAGLLCLKLPDAARPQEMLPSGD